MENREKIIEEILSLELEEGDVALLGKNLSDRRANLKILFDVAGFPPAPDDFDKSFKKHNLTRLRLQSMAAQHARSLESILDGSTVMRCMEETPSQLEKIAETLIGHSVSLYLAKNPHIVEECYEQACITNGKDESRLSDEFLDDSTEKKRAEVDLFLYGEMIRRGVKERLLEQLIPNR